MKQVIQAEIELTVLNPHEIMSTGGPYTADIYIGSQLISKDCIAANFLYEKITNLFFFVKHHLVGNYHYFTINFYKLDDNTVYEFLREFEMVYIKTVY